MRRTLAATILAVVVFSCDDNETTLPDNFISAEKNDVAWTGRTEISYGQYSGDTLAILGIGTEEVLAMKIKFAGTGDYLLKKHQGAYSTTLGGDVLTSLYETDDGSYVGAVKITRYDEDEKIMEGNFEVSLKQIRSNPQNGIDVMTFTRGQFKGKIRQ
jgi:hypothetical protein